MAFLGELTALQLFLIWGVILLAALLRAFTGFGFALAAMPIFALILPPHDAVVLSASLALGIGLVTAPSYRKDIPFGSLWPMVPATLIGTALGASILLQLEPRHFLLGIGLAVIAACLGLTFFRPQRASGTRNLAALIGASSGLLNGAFAIPGPPVIVYALATEPEPARARALLLSFFTFSAFTALLSYGYAGLVGWRSLWLFVVAFPVMLVGDRLGLWLFRGYGSNAYRKVAVAALLVIGVAATVKALI